MKMGIITYLLILYSNYFYFTNGARILAHFLIPAVSHQNFYRPIWRELSLRGHEVTVITSDPLDDISLTNLTEINVNSSYQVMWDLNSQESCSKSNSIFHNYYYVTDKVFLSVLEHELNLPDVQKLMELGEDHFDLIIVEGLNPLIYGYGRKFKAPIVAISSIEIFTVYYDGFGNPTHPLITPDWIASYYLEQPTFYQKVQVVLYNIWSRAWYYWYSLPKADRLATKYFGEETPPLLELIQNTSLILVNRNSILHTPRANVPSVIEIGQLHLKDPKPLPKDLQQYLDNSTRGVIYFSLGTNIISTTLHSSLTENIREAFSEIPYDVIWKFEEDDLPGKTPNIMLRKWLPQQDLLRHPNVKVFVFQGGVQSLDESIFGEVPMVGIPFFADQPLNVKMIQDKGMGVGLDFATLTKDSLKTAILEVANNKRYKEQVIKYKHLIEDQPMKGLEKAVWWIEYVIRTKGAKHMRSPAATMSFVQYFLIDIIAYLVLFICIFIYLLGRLLKLCSRFNDSKIKVH